MQVFFLFIVTQKFIINALRNIMCCFVVRFTCCNVGFLFVFSKYAVVKFVGYDTCDVVPTAWISVEDVVDADDDTVRAWYPNCNISKPNKCLQLVKAGGPVDRAHSSQYDVKMMYLTGNLW